jgi:hypothetical protein
VLLAKNSQGIRPLGMSVCKWEHVVKVVFKEVCWDDLDWIDLALVRDFEVDYREYLSEPWRSIKYGKFIFWMGTYYILNKGFCFVALIIYLVQHMWILKCTCPLLRKLRADELLPS